MRSLVAFAAAASMIAAPVLALDEVPPVNALPLSNAVGNAGFENGFASWGIRHNVPPLAAPGAHGTTQAVSFPNAAWCSYIYQPVDRAVATQDLLLVDFHARVTPDAGAANGNRVILYDEGVTGSDLSADVTFIRDIVSFSAWGAGATVLAPTDGAWHQYTVLLARPLGLGVLLVDGVPAANVIGQPDSVNPADTFLVGDTACNDVPNPSVTFDEFFVGPVV